MRSRLGYSEGPSATLMRSAICVWMTPGSTIATRTLNDLTSCARHSHRASRANFEAVYGSMGDNAKRPAMEATLMMQPLCAWRMDGSTAWMQRRAPK